MPLELALALALTVGDAVVGDTGAVVLLWYMSSCLTVALWINQLPLLSLLLLMLLIIILDDDDDDNDDDAEDRGSVGGPPSMFFDGIEIGDDGIGICRSTQPCTTTVAVEKKKTKTMKRESIEVYR